jgi:hypothetical protein
MNDSYALRNYLDAMLSHYVGQTFTETMRRCIRPVVSRIQNAAYDEGQSALAPYACKYSGTSFCPQCERTIGLNEYDVIVCRQCREDGGFEI